MAAEAVIKLDEEAGVDGKCEVTDSEDVPEIWSEIGPLPKHMHAIWYNEAALKILYHLLAQRTMREYVTGQPEELTVWTDGEFDGVQTEFERKSNHLKIGVWAGSKHDATVLLRLVRILVDDHWGSLEGAFMDVAPDCHDIRVTDTIEALSKMNTHVSKHPNSDRIETTLLSWDEETRETTRITIRTTADEMDLWGIDRLLVTYTQRFIAAHE